MIDRALRIMFSVTLILCAWILMRCSTPFAVTAGDAFQATSDGTRAAINIARPILDRECKATLGACMAAKPPDAVCAPLKKCQSIRAKIFATAATVHATCAAGLLTLKTAIIASEGIDNLRAKVVPLLLEAGKLAADVADLIAQWRKAIK